MKYNLKEIINNCKYNYKYSVNNTEKCINNIKRIITTTTNCYKNSFLKEILLDISRYYKNTLNETVHNKHKKK